MDRSKPEEAEIQSLGQQLLAATTNSDLNTQLQELLDNVNTTWQNVEGRVGDRLVQCHEVIQEWAELEQQRSPVVQGLARVATVTDQPIKCNSQEEAERLLAEHKVSGLS